MKQHLRIALLVLLFAVGCSSKKSAVTQDSGSTVDAGDSTNPPLTSATETPTTDTMDQQLSDAQGSLPSTFQAPTSTNASGYVNIDVRYGLNNGIPCDKRPQRQ